jgi:lipoprotein-releasing system permease protein
MNYTYWIGYRYIKAKKQKGFVSLISILSVLGVTIGVMALIVVIGVMQGFRSELERKIIGMNASLVVEKDLGIERYGSVLEKIEKIEGVEAVAPYIIGYTMVRSRGRAFGIVLRGIDRDKEPRVTGIKEHLKQGDMEISPWGVLVGKHMAARLGVDIGDYVVLISPADGSEYEVQIRGIFESGMFEYDFSVMFIGIKEAQEFFILPDTVSGIGVRTKDNYDVGKVGSEIEQVLDFPFYARTWQEANERLFAALQLERTVMFIILTLIIVVASFGISSVLIMTVMEKIKDIGILKALGATSNSIRLIFTFYGLLIGGIGTFIGSLLGIGICVLIETTDIVRLPADIYHFEKLPVQLQLLDIFLIISCAIAISFIATLYPSHQAARLNPVEALRYE